MVFNSITFFVFLTVVLSLYYVLGHRLQNRMLLVCSYVFYGWWDPRFLCLIVLSTVVDFVAGLCIERGRMSLRHRAAVSASVLASAVLCLCVNWSAAPAVLSGDTDLLGLVSADVWTVGIPIVALLGGVVAGANALYPLMTRLPDRVRRGAMLWVSVGINLGILGTFKYFNFFVGSLEQALGAAGVAVESLRLHLILPVGISFYTFQTMSYTIDVYRRHMRATDRFLDFALYVAYFPQLVAGPIERAADLLPRILRPRKIAYEQVCRGSFLILMGLFKKVAIADGVARTVNSIYSGDQLVSAPDVTVATVMFALQIYCDFSGYTDIARGVSKLLGIELMLNFNLPYFSQNPSEFWRRWHISLSTWLRDYLYIPLGGNRLGRWRTYRNLMATMILGGLWHGAAWNFVLWGMFHGGALCIHRAVAGRNPAPEPLQPRVIDLFRHGWKIAFFFVVTCYGWLLFRAESAEQILKFTQIVTMHWNDEWTRSFQVPRFSAVLGIPVLALYEILQYRSSDARFYQRWPAFLRGALYAVLLFILVLGTSNETRQFIYFQF